MPCKRSVIVCKAVIQILTTVISAVITVVFIFYFAMNIGISTLLPYFDNAGAVFPV